MRYILIILLAAIGFASCGGHHQDTFIMQHQWKIDQGERCGDTDTMAFNHGQFSCWNDTIKWIDTPVAIVESVDEASGILKLRSLSGGKSIVYKKLDGSR